jgi:ubiquinone/menaquinone biosynthesis C-methylase UbiE
MAEHVCPWWLGYFLINPFRRWRQDPRQILSPYVGEGMTVLEPGPGMGFFTLELAEMVGAAGRVVAIDIQAKMLEKLKRRAAARGLHARIETRLAQKASMPVSDLREKVDFLLAFAMVHELPAARPFFQQAAECLKPGAFLLLAEPRGHVKAAQFETELAAAADAGFAVAGRPPMSKSHTVLLRKRAAH